MIQTQFAHTITVPDEWEAYVNSCIAHLIAMEEIKEVC